MKPGCPRAAPMLHLRGCSLSWPTEGGHCCMSGVEGAPGAGPGSSCEPMQESQASLALSLPNNTASNASQPGLKAYHYKQKFRPEVCTSISLECPGFYIWLALIVGRHFCTPFPAPTSPPAGHSGHAWEPWPCMYWEVAGGTKRCSGLVCMVVHALTRLCWCSRAGGSDFHGMFCITYQCEMQGGTGSGIRAITLFRLPRKRGVCQKGGKPTFSKSTS